MGKGTDQLGTRQGQGKDKLFLHMSPFLAGLSAALPASCLSSLPLLVAWWPRWWWVGSTQHQTSVSCHLTPFFFFFTYLQFTVPAVTSSIHPIDAHIERAKGLAWLDRIGGDAELDWTSRWMGLDVLILLLLLFLLFLFFFFILLPALPSVHLFCAFTYRYYEIQGGMDMESRLDACFGWTVGGGDLEFLFMTDGMMFCLSCLVAVLRLDLHLVSTAQHSTAEEEEWNSDAIFSHPGLALLLRTVIQVRAQWKGTGKETGSELGKMGRGQTGIGTLALACRNY